MVVILGLGFTGQRLARRLLREGEKVFAAVRGIERFRNLGDAGLVLSELAHGAVPLPKHAKLVHLIPPLPDPENYRLHEVIENLQPARVIYVSSTGVYGEQSEVNGTTATGPADERGRRRLQEEQWISAHTWSTLTLRAAAIYGPGRGVHVVLREGKLPRGAGSGIVSRIHVDDLAAIIAAGISSNLEGAWPVADDEPCASAEIAAWCAQQFGIPQPAAVSAPIAGRRVNGTEVRRKLAMELRYPSWKTGIPASIAEEEAEKRTN